jgi:hypothetical protein
MAFQHSVPPPHPTHNSDDRWRLVNRGYGREVVRLDGLNCRCVIQGSYGYRFPVFSAVRFFWGFLTGRILVVAFMLSSRDLGLDFPGTKFRIPAASLIFLCFSRESESTRLLSYDLKLLVRQYEDILFCLIRPHAFTLIMQETGETRAETRTSGSPRMPVGDG